MPTEWLRTAIERAAGLFPDSSLLSQPFFIKALLAVALVSLICGLVGSLVVGNRMAFFSDALAHCAFAGVALGLLIALLQGVDRSKLRDAEFITPVMIAFGIVVGLAIAFVREQTGLASDTVIGVFFAGAIGFGALLLTALRNQGNYDPDAFLFGSPHFVTEGELLGMIVLAALTAALVAWRYNHFVFASVNPSLARSRRIPLRLYNYAFIVLLALIVNVSIKAVGALLINALLVVPAATASNLSRNMRQLFWLTVVLSVVAGVGGLALSTAFHPRVGRGDPLEFGPGGMIVVVSVLLFFVSMPLRGLVRGRQPA